MAKLVELGDFQYDLKAMIGKGAFGSVYECKHKTKPELSLCIKIIEQGLDDPKILREMNLMKEFITTSKGNPNIVSVEFVDIQKDKILIVLERCDGDLQQLIDRKRKNGETFHPAQALEIIKQIVNGYKILFVNNIIHRDMKPANILYKGEVYKIADFGLARVIDSQQQQELTKVGTPKYAAPQLFHEPTFTNSADIFSIGIIFYELVFGSLPYKVSSQADVRRATRNLKTNPIKLDLNKAPGMTLDIAELIEYMLKYSEKERISWAALFEHPLIQTTDGGNINQSKLLQVNEVSDEEEEETPVQTQPPAQVPVQPPQQHQQPVQPQFQPQQNSTNTPQGRTDQTVHTPGNFQPPAVPFKPVTPTQPNFQPANSQFKSAFPSNVQQAPVVFAPQSIQPLPRNPIHTITQQQIYTIMSDQLFGIGVFHQCAFELLDKYTTIVNPIRNEIMGLKLQLYYLACSFFEHAKAQKNSAPIVGTIQQNIVESELTKQNSVKQQLDQELRDNKLTFCHQLKPVSPTFSEYSQKLLQFYAQGKQTLTYSNDKKYYLEYLQLLYIFEKFEEYKQKISNVSDLYACIQEIQKTISIEQTVRNYIQQRRNC